MHQAEGERKKALPRFPFTFQFPEPGHMSIFSLITDGEKRGFTIGLDRIVIHLLLLVPRHHKETNWGWGTDTLPGPIDSCLVPEKKIGLQ